MKSQTAYLCITILLAAAAFTATCASAKKHANETSKAPKWNEEATKTLQMIKRYETCNINYVTSNKMGEVLISFRPSCNKSKSMRRTSLASGSRGLINDTIYCIINFVQHIAMLRFKVPNICCTLGFPLNLVFVLFCRSSTSPPYLTTTTTRPMRMTTKTIDYY